MAASVQITLEMCLCVMNVFIFKDFYFFSTELLK